MNDEDVLTTTRENTSRGRNDEGSPVPMSKGSLITKENLKSIDMYRSPPSGIPRKASNHRKQRNHDSGQFIASKLVCFKFSAPLDRDSLSPDFTIQNTGESRPHRITNKALERMQRLTQLETIDAGGGNAGISSDARSIAVASVNLPSDKQNFQTKRSIMHSMNIIEQQKIKAMKVLEKMQQQFERQVRMDAMKTLEQEERERQNLLWRQQIQKQRESRNRKRIEQLQEL